MTKTTTSSRSISSLETSLSAKPSRSPSKNWTRITVRTSKTTWPAMNCMERRKTASVKATFPHWSTSRTLRAPNWRDSTYFHSFRWTESIRKKARWLQSSLTWIWRKCLPRRRSRPREDLDVFFAVANDLYILFFRQRIVIKISPRMLYTIKYLIL